MNNFERNVGIFRHFLCETGFLEDFASLLGQVLLFFVSLAALRSRDISLSEDGKVVYPLTFLSMNSETQLRVSYLAKGIHFLHFSDVHGPLQKVIVKEAQTDYIT
ncbi:hypothetical protein [Fluviicola sp.]|uniref:hypothetical protein n=1 Tax=Fluviicola sp. TaxID=1917219 RepID=UPI00281FBA07|nr:hypothetical protein [Fluviicola sp.]MDR0801426.1 T9SS type A sorting domain-containing protein [Fluviicola sp.]